METAFVGIVLTAIGQLTIVNVVLAATVSLDDANDHKEKDEEGKSEDHADEPARSCDAVISLRHHDDI